MTITIDCRHIDSSGIGVYLTECLPFLLESPNNFNLAGRSGRLETYASGRKNVSIIDCAVKPFSLAELFAFPKKILKVINSGDAYYTPYFNIPRGIKVPVYVTIHDIIFADMPELVSRAGYYARMFFYRRAAKLAKSVFTVSSFSASRINAHLAARRIVIAPPGISRAVRQAAKEGGFVKTKTIVFAGNIKKHKGLSLLIRAFKSALSRGLDYKLVILGGKLNLRTRDEKTLKEIKSSLDSAANIEWKENIPPREFCALLGEAALLVQSSLYEGFGLPPLEAMALGTTALISDIAVFKEVYAEFPVVFFRAGDEGSLRDKLLELLYNRKIDMIPSVSLSRAQMEIWSFENCARLILEELCRNAA
ncbi:MAG: glycosyltransferase family 4 protein [Spirochaetaceae bacterium]|jgi:glycosyltransferase involved in cell wall biosynthesis|nr:glycosyltransferase family 4 protein [Spirochaetaceae bacterium]